MGMILDGIELPVCCGEGFRIYPYRGDVIITCDGTPKFRGTNIPREYPCNKSKRLQQLKDGILWEDCDYCGGDLYEETQRFTRELPDDVEDLTVCEGCWEKHYEQFEAEDQSAYWFLKGEMQSRAPLSEMDLEQILEMLQNVPKKEMNEAIEQAEMMGDEAAMIVLVMADNKRKFREEYASEDEPSVEKITNFFAALKAQNPDLARKIEFSVKNYDDLPRKEIESAGFDYDKIEEWVDYVGSEDANLVEFEPCSDCEGDGYVMVSGSYFGGDRYDPPDADFEECEACAGSGEIDPADYMDKKGQYYAETFEARDDSWCVNHGWIRGGTKIGDIIPCTSCNDMICESCRCGGCGNCENSDCCECSHNQAAETKKRKAGIRKCSKCGDYNHNAPNCNRLNEYEEYLKHKDEMLRQCDRAIDEFTRDAKEYSEDGEYDMAKMLRSDATDMKKLKRMIEKNHFGKAVHFAMGMDSQPRDLAPSALWLFASESFESDSWLTEGKCAICNSPSKFTVMTAIGERSFCCEACYADYMGLPVEKEGYYGLASETKSMNHYLLGAGIFALTLGILSRKV